MKPNGTWKQTKNINTGCKGYIHSLKDKSKAVNKLLIQGWHQGPRHPRLRTPKNPNHDCVIKSDSTDGLKTFQAHNGIFAQPYSFKKKLEKERQRSFGSTLVVEHKIKISNHIKKNT